MSSHYLIHLPHSGRKIPAEYLDSYLLSEDELQQNIDHYCDLYTDELFGSLFEKFGGVKSPYSRLFVDPERFGDDSFEEMHKRHRLGWFYENAILTKKPLRTTMQKSSIRHYFDDHHRVLNTKTAEKLERYGRCTVIDCHSFSNERYWFHDKSLQLPDICIGFEEGHVDETVVKIINNVFSGYKVGINVPYAGSLVPTDYWGKDFRVKSVMIEINKKLYLKADNVTKSSDFYIIKNKIEQIMEQLQTGSSDEV